MKAIVTGTGRSGTGYTAKVLSAAGLPCGHEAIFTPDGIRQNTGLEADASWMALPHLDTFAVNTPILLIYRHPTRVIGSFMGIRFFEQRPHPSHYPYVRTMNAIAPDVFAIRDAFERACQWYVAANRIALASANLVEPLEDIRWNRVAELLGPGLEVHRALPLVPQDINHRVSVPPKLPPLPGTVWDIYEELTGAAQEGIRWTSISN